MEKAVMEGEKEKCSGFKERGVWATERGSNEGSGWKSGAEGEMAGGRLLFGIF